MHPKIINNKLFKPLPNPMFMLASKEKKVTQSIQVILDTNFLLIPGMFKIDIFSEINKLMDFHHQLYIIDKSLDELKKIAETGNGKEKTAAKLAIVLSKQKNIKILGSLFQKNVDDAIVSKASKDFYVATQDKELKRRLKEKNIKIITLRNKNHLIIT